VSYSVIVADPPWNEPGGCKRGADEHYETMDRAAILRTMVTSPSWHIAEDAHLYLWTTMTSLVDGLWLLDALGFVYKTHAVWVKTTDTFAPPRIQVGLGQYFRGAHELVLFGTRGKGFAVRTEAKNIPSVIFAQVPRENGRRVHSAKPAAFFDMVDRRSVGPRLEMFARVGRPGWDAWGDEAPVIHYAADHAATPGSIV
jgi:N6-adenosine-specific RNA methylase IME4